MNKSVFIGSSSENVKVARAIQENLERDGFIARVWDQGIFNLSETTIESLMTALSTHDYAVFVFAPDDITKLRGDEFATTRDNVIFEFGLFIGALGRESCYFVMPKNTNGMHLPTDLLGITAATYSLLPDEINIPAALGTACNQIARAISIAESQTDATKQVSIPCGADWAIANRESVELGVSIQSIDTSHLHYLLLSVRSCKHSRIHIGNVQVNNYPDIRIEAMYDLMGAWDLLIKYRAGADADKFEKEIIDKLVDENEMDDVQEDVFGRRKSINVLTQSRSFLGLINQIKNETIEYNLLRNSQEYERHRAERAFLFIEALGNKNDNNRKLLLKHLHDAIENIPGTSIIESVCEGESEFLIETFSSCSQSNKINHLNKAVSDVLTIHRLQKYTLSCYEYDESGLLESATFDNGEPS